VFLAAALAGPLACSLAAARAEAQAPPTARPRARAGAAAQGDAVNPAILARLRVEAIERSQVLETASWLTDVYGGRLTGSPAARAAAEWAGGTLGRWGLRDVRLEPWGPFGRGWSSERLTLLVTAPQPFTAIAYPSAWTPGTNGTVTGEPVLVEIDSEPDFARYRGRLAGRLVMLGVPRELPTSFAPQARRLTDAELDSLARLPAPTSSPTGPQTFAQLPEAMRRTLELQARRQRFLAEERPAAVLLQGRGDGGTVGIQSAGGSWDAAARPTVPTVVVAAEHYGRIARTLQKGVPVTLELTARSTFHDGELGSFNLLAELPGRDPRLHDEVVMVGAHLDSWHGGTGATDNAAGWR
jgi:hypothetical protein